MLKLVTPNRTRPTRTPIAVATPPQGWVGADALGSRQHGPNLEKTNVRRSPVELELVIPAYNEESRIMGTLASVTDYLRRQTFSTRVVVVNNGSFDGTTEAVDRAGFGPDEVVVIGCSDRGKGAAVRRGVVTSTARFIGFCDADLATPIERLDAVMPLLREGWPVVVGCRRCPGSEIASRQGPVRRLGGWVFRQAVRTVVPDLHDTQCGFKFFAGSVARSLFALGRVDGFAFDVEVLWLAASMGYPVMDVPVCWSDRRGSTFHLLRDGWNSWANVLALHQSLRTKQA